MQRIRLDHHNFQLQCAQQGLQGRALVELSGVKRGLGNRHTQLTCIERDLGDKSRGSISTIDLSG